MNELKQDLKRITDSYINSISGKRTKSNKLESMSQGLKLTAEYMPKLAKELEDRINKYMNENNIDFTPKIKELMASEINRFNRFALNGKR